MTRALSSLAEELATRAVESRAARNRALLYRATDALQDVLDRLSLPADDVRAYLDAQNRLTARAMGLTPSKETP